MSGFWRMRVPKLDKSGNVVVGGMWSHQREWWGGARNFIRALVTGYGGGKTFVGGKRSISLALQNQGSPHLVISPSYKMAKRTIIPTIMELLEGRHLDYSYNKSDFELIIKHGKGGKIWFASGDNPDSLKGPNIGSALIDEPFIQDEAVFQQTIARVRDPNARQREICLTGTPEQLNWGYELCEGEIRESLEAQGIYVKVVQASTRRNRALDPQYLAALTGGMDEKARAAYIDGQFVDLSSGRVYYAYDINRNATTRTAKDGESLHIGMDFNVDPMTAIICVMDGEAIHACDEIVLPASDTRSLCREIVQRYPRSPVTVYPDASGKARSSKGWSDFDIIRDEFGKRLADLIFPRKNPYLRDRFNAMNGALEHIVLGLNVNKCPELAKDLRQVAHPYDDYKRKNPRRTHASDAVGYLVTRVRPVGRAAAEVRVH